MRNGSIRTVVTGGAGFIGSHLVDAFVQQGHKVVVIDNLTGGLRENVNSLAQLVICDIRSRQARATITDFGPHVLCHQAAQTNLRKSVDDPVLDVEVNVAGLVSVLEAARCGGELEHVLFASSGGAMYGETDTVPTPEDHNVWPASPYGLAKVVGEQYLRLYQYLYGISYTALRYANVYGPRQNPGTEAGVVSIFIDRLLTGRPLTINGDGEQTRDFIYVEDVVRANLVSLDKRIEGGFNVGTGLETSVNRLAEMLGYLAGSDCSHSYSPAAKGEQRRSAIDPRKLEAAAGFHPTTDLSAGLRQTLDFVRSQKGIRLRTAAAGRVHERVSLE